MLLVGKGLSVIWGFWGVLARATRGLLNSACLCRGIFRAFHRLKNSLLFDPAALPDGLAARLRGMRFARQTTAVAGLCSVIWIIVK